MNISQAKETIKNTVKMYLKKDEFGDYRIPVVRQRPVFLLGAPGIGKTAIMEQVASELGIALVSYSMTHHTRQSALGLPYIEKKNYDGEEYSVSEYTMSEIIASVYETMEISGVKEGILFLDEINCVSETLAPSMLQFLQYKVFGRHRVPEGWVIVTAGNPPEYNRSVREFDVVTMDRLKVLEVEADLPAWRVYAKERQIHGAIMGFLDMKREYFYLMETTAEGRGYVTARGWEDLSQIIYLYEEEGLEVTEELISQYIRSGNVAAEFSAYYDLYRKYNREYNIDRILSEGPFEEAYLVADRASLDEKVAVTGMLSDRVGADMRDVMEKTDVISEAGKVFRQVKEAAGAQTGNDSAEDILEKAIGDLQKKMTSLERAGSLSPSEKKKQKSTLVYLGDALSNVKRMGTPDIITAYDSIKAMYEKSVGDIRDRSEIVRQETANVYAFLDGAFGEGNEKMMFTTSLTSGSYSARFIAAFGSDEYVENSKKMMVYDRSADLRDRIIKLDLE